MGGKKIDRKKQSLLSRAAKRKATIKKLSHKPVIKKVDVEAIKESFKNKLKSNPEISKTTVVASKEDVQSVETPVVVKKRTAKPKKED